MVKKTYYNLSDKKKKQLLDIAKKEFSKYPLYKASINRIIKNYGIARGSYYNYFDNIEDLYFCVIDDFKKDIDSKVKEVLIEYKGDLFKSFEFVFNYLIELEGCEKELFKNVFLNMNLKLQGAFLEKKKSQEINKPSFIQYINFELYNIKDKSEIKNLIGILKAITIHSLMRCFIENISKNEANKLYKAKLETIKYGIYKEVKDVT